MQVTKGTWRMRKWCVPGSLSSSGEEERESLGTRLGDMVPSRAGMTWLNLMSYVM